MGIWQCVVMVVAGSMLLLAGILFDSAWETTRQINKFYWEGW